MKKWYDCMCEEVKECECVKTWTCMLVVKDNSITGIGKLLPRYQHTTTHMRGNTSV